MGKTTGFLEYRRSLPVLRPAEHRVGDWSEFHSPLDETELSKQAARCMDCGTPFCHIGESFDGVTKGCPIHNLIPEWNDLVFHRRFEEAYERLALTNNFPEFTGRVCPAPCESSCILGINDDPVMIKEIEVSIIDRAFDEGWIQATVPPDRTGKTVAVVGSGPAGLACADELNKFGHNVTVFERDDRIGGLLMYGIPNMKLDKAIVERRVDLLRSAGITFRAGVAVGSDVLANDLKADYDAVVVCTGAPKPRDLNVEGRDSEGIHFAMEFLTENTRHVLGSADGERKVDVAGKNVIVIGGGDTGTDCVATSLRLGCKSLTQFEIMSRFPDRVADHEHWLLRSRDFQVDYGQEESIEQFGHDPRAYSLLTKRFIENAGKLTGVETVSVELKDGKISEIAGTEKVWAADIVLLAMGFTGVEKGKLLEDLGVEITDRSTIAIDENKQTSVPGVFAAGDCERGQSLVVWAIADGRRAAVSVNEYLTIT